MGRYAQASRRGTNNTPAELPLSEITYIRIGDDPGNQAIYFEQTGGNATPYWQAEVRVAGQTVWTVSPVTPNAGTAIVSNIPGYLAGQAAHSRARDTLADGTPFNSFGFATSFII